jgi:hypothetical protein
VSTDLPSENRCRSGRALSRLLGFLAGLVAFLLLFAVLAVWAAGRFSPSILDSVLNSRSGSSLSVETNDTNLFAGRISFGGARITGSSRWQERSMLGIREAKVDFVPTSMLGDGPRVIRELVLDVDELVVAGREDYFKDNNLNDLIRSFSADGAPAGQGSAAEPARFRIEKLSLRVRRVRVIAGDGTDRRRTVVDREAGLSLDATGVDETNLEAKVWKPLTSRLTGLAAEVGVDAVVDRAREKIFRAAESLLSPR